jgi:hypothetical protein
MLFGARPSARSAAPSSLRSSALCGTLLACVVIGACGEDEPDGPGPDNSSARARRPTAIATEQQQIGAHEQDRLAQARRAPPAVDPYANTEGAAKKVEEAAAAAAAKEEKPRDYPAELLSAMRGAESCVKPRLASEGLPAELPISLEGLVLESGTVVTGAARAPVLTPEELECVKRRLESTRIPADVKDAPRRINATLTLKFKKEAPAANTGGSPAAPTAPKAY